MLAPPAAATTGCSPSSTQAALFTSANYGGSCANYSVGAYPSVSANGGIPDNSATSIKVGSSVVAVLHKDPSFGGTTDDSWQTFAASDSSLTNNYWQGTDNDADDVIAGTTSALWVLQTGCTPGASQVAVFDLASYGGGCVLIGQGTFASMVAAGVPNDFVGSLKVGSAAKVQIYKNTSQGGSSCTYNPGQQTTTICFGDNQASSITVTAAPPTTSATLALTKAVPGTSTTEVAGSVTGLANTTYSLTFYADTTCGAEKNQLGTIQATTAANGYVAFDTTVGTAAAGGSLVSATATEPNHTASTPSACITAGPDNTAWPSALPVALDGNGNGGSNGTLDLSGQARWYRFAVAPGEHLQIDLTKLPANYDVALFSDIGQAFTSLNSTSDLQQLSAEFAPSSFAPSSFAPSSFAPSSFASFTDTNGTYEAAQATSLVAYSAADGTADEHIVASSWNNSGSFYIRVTGRNGAYVPGVPFTLSVHEDQSSCANIAPSGAQLLTTPVPTGVKTLILADFERMPADGLSTMESKLQAFAALPQVGGAIVDVGAASPQVQALFAQADANPGCVYAENLVASAIANVVDAYRAQSAGLQDIVVIGNDHEIPFFRYPDASGLGTESNYVPPVADGSPSQASLRLDYVLSQDAYGAQTTLHINGLDLPVPDLPVGRLVETPGEISGMLDAYMDAKGAVSPTSSLVTGYDFLAGSAQEVANDFSAALGGTQNDTLISPEGTAPSDSWTANDLRAQLLNKPHGLIYLAGHFSADNALAADYSTTMDSSELAASNISFENSIVFSAGCHSGYNIVDGDSIPYVTQPIDWVQAFAEKQATVVAGTGYQYGDTDFVAYSAKLYASFAQDLVAGGTVPVGNALVAAKEQYLEATPQLSGIDVKALLEATLYGLPMLGVTTPGAAVQHALNVSAAAAVSPTTVGSDPGKTLGLSSADEDYTPTLTPQSTTLNLQGGGTVTATYLEGPDGVVTAPGSPALPLAVEDVTVPGQVLRGVGFLGGSFTATSGITPLTGDPTTDLSATHAPFTSTTLFPERPWSINYFGGISDGSTSTRLMLTPVQYQSSGPSSTTDNQLVFSDVGVRLFYSANTSGSALAAPPTIARVDASSSGGVVTFTVHVVGDPAAGIQDVWVTYLPLGGNRWQSLDLTQGTTDTTLWTKTLQTSGPIEFMVQAVNGVGLVSLDDNAGAFYQPNQIAPALQTASTLTPTRMTLSPPASPVPYGSQVSVSATLQASGSPVADGTPVTFAIGHARATVLTSGGTATAQLQLVDLPGGYQVSASYGGSSTLAGSSDSASFTIASLPSTLSLMVTGSGGTVTDGSDTGIGAMLASGDTNTPLGQRTVEFVLAPSSGTPIVQTRITDPSGFAALGVVPLPLAGTYTVTAFFGPGGPTPPTLGADPVYMASSVSPGVALNVSQASVSSINLVGSSPTNAASVSWTVMFNANVFGVSKSNFTLAGSGLSGAAITSVTGSGSSYTVTASTGADGLLELDLSSIGGIADSVGGGLAGTLKGQSFLVDRTPPVITASAAPPPNASGWNNSDVTVTFTCSDTGSGLATSCPPPVILGQGAGETATGMVTDNAGNPAKVTTAPINVDETPPVVAVTGVTNGAVYQPGSVPTPGCQTSDALSGVATNASVTVSGGSGGSFTAACSGATDRAGNAAATVSVSYQVVGTLGNGTTICNGAYGGTGSNVTVPAGAVCTLIPGTKVNGNIQVQQGGALNDQGATVGGNLQAASPVWIKVSGGSIGGNLSIQGLTGAPAGVDNSLCSAAISGNVAVQGSGASSPIDIGNLGACAGGAGLTIAGNLQVSGNAGAVQVGGNTVKGNLTVQANTGGGTLKSNSSGGNCTLGGNAPGIAGSSNTASGQNSCNATA
ncbi:MAG TPA: hypothetical protein VLV28_09785 [Gaiellaceae bacterium]|nr:hypothetical protein [Gaiellaceae bacterium]